MKNLYELLWLDAPGDIEITQDDIRRAYRERVKEAHPDAGGTPEHFREIQRAYEILSDPVKRKLYDEKGEAGVSASRQEEIEDSILGVASKVFELAPPGTRDLIAAVCEKLAECVQNAEIDLDLQKGNLGRLRKMKARISYHGAGRDILGDYFEKEEIALEKKIRTAEHAIEIGNESIAHVGAWTDAGQAFALPAWPGNMMRGYSLTHGPDCICWTCCPN